MRGSKAKLSRRKAVQVVRHSSQQVDNVNLLVVTMLAQLGGSLTLSRGTIERVVVRGEFPRTFEIVDGASQGERVVRFKPPVIGETAPALTPAQWEEVDRRHAALKENGVTVVTVDDAGETGDAASSL